MLLRPIALAEGVMYRLVLVHPSCSLVDKHQVIDDEESSESESSFLFQGFFRALAAGSLIWSAISAPIRDAKSSILQNASSWVGCSPQKTREQQLVHLCGDFDKTLDYVGVNGI